MSLSKDTEELFGYITAIILSCVILVLVLLFFGPWLLSWCKTNWFIVMLFAFAGILGLEGYAETSGKS